MTLMQNLVLRRCREPLQALLIAFVMSFGGLNPAMGQDLQTGSDAFYAEDFETAMQTLLPLAEGGHPREQALVGFMFMHGKSVPVDHDVAARWYLKSAAQGDARAQYILALMYTEGAGVPRDMNQALHYHRLVPQLYS